MMPTWAGDAVHRDSTGINGAFGSRHAGHRPSAHLRPELPWAAAGIYNRIAQRLLAMAMSIWHNWAAAESVKRSLTAYDD